MAHSGQELAFRPVCGFCGPSRRFGSVHGFLEFTVYGLQFEQQFAFDKRSGDVVLQACEKLNVLVVKGALILHVLEDQVACQTVFHLNPQDQHTLGNSDMAGPFFTRPSLHILGDEDIFQDLFRVGNVSLLDFFM